MRRILCIALASTFLAGAPVIPEPVQAQSLFETLFPRTAERRRQRLNRERIRREREIQILERNRRLAERRNQEALKVVKVKAATFKDYFARKLSPIRLASLSNSFVAYDKKLVAAEEARLRDAMPAPQSEQRTELTPVILASQASDEIKDDTASSVVDLEQPDVQSQPLPAITQEAVELVSTLPSIRLSAGVAQLKQLKLRATPALGKALVAWYKKNPQFLWLDENGYPNAKADMVMRELARADEYGLRNSDYSMPLLDADESTDETDKLRAALQYEFSTTLVALRYMQDARNGVVDPNRISGYHDFKNLQLGFDNAIQALADADVPNEVLLSAHPRDKAFDALRRELVSARQAANGFDAITIKNGTLIKAGQTSDQLTNIVESIRRMGNEELMANHFEVFMMDHSEGEYTPEVVAMVRDFQRSVKLKADGIVGKNTIARMKSDDPIVKLNKVLFAMERLRWHPDQLGNRHVFINQPAYRATYINNGKEALSMRTVVGKPSNQTNFFYDEIEYVEFNPYWGVPRSILVNEMLPKLRRNASYLDNQGYEITDRKGRAVWSSQVNWSTVGANFPYNVRQPPGEKNALGSLKIMFPNKHAIYMHDTPAKSLFNRDKRAYSHGCVRLAEPQKMAAAVLGSTINDVQDRIFRGTNNRQKLKVKVPVYVSYFTAWPTQEGTVKYYGDVYGRDDALAKAMAIEASARDAAKDV